MHDIPAVEPLLVVNLSASCGTRYSSCVTAKMITFFCNHGTISWCTRFSTQKYSHVCNMYQTTCSEAVLLFVYNFISNYILYILQTKTGFFYAYVETSCFRRNTVQRWSDTRPSLYHRNLYERVHFSQFPKEIQRTSFPYQLCIAEKSPKCY